MRGNPDGYGSYSFASPVEINCRWEDKLDIVRNAAGVEVVSTSRVFVDREILTDSFMYLGLLSEVTGQNPQSITGAFQVISFISSPNIAGTERILSVRL